jgi:hypothetical protein
MATKSGQTVVTTAGTEVVLGSELINGPVLVKALPGNTDLVYLGNVDEAVSSSSGLPLSAGDAVIINRVGSLASLFVDAAVNGEGVAWLAMEL